MTDEQGGTSTPDEDEGGERTDETPDEPADADADHQPSGGDEGRAAATDRVTEADLAALRDELDDLADDVEDRTVHRDEIEGDLKRYVRRRVRRGHATGWGPYLVLLYGTAMTIGAFYFLEGPWAVLAMLVIWLSTLGLYTLMVLVGVTITVVGVPGRLRDAVRDFRG